MVDSSVEVYRRMSEELLPTPQKSHYTFNLRDLSKVLQGMLLITPDKCKSLDVMTRLWVHESMRVFHDRLISVEDKDYYKVMASELVEKNFAVVLEGKYEDPPVRRARCPSLKSTRTEYNGHQGIQGLVWQKSSLRRLPA